MVDTVITIDATIGGATTNSYIDLPEADALVQGRPFHDVWDKATLSDDQKKAALVWATRILSHFQWKGTYVTETQALPWPRDGVYNKDGKAYLTTAYPEWLKVATAELALAMITDDRLGDSGTEGFSKIKLGPLDLSIDPKDRISWVPDYIIRGIKFWFAGANTRLNASVSRV